MFRFLCFATLFVGLNCAPHKHHHITKTVFIGTDGEAASNANFGAAGGLSVGASASLGGGGGVVRNHEVISEKVIDVEAPPVPELKAHKTVIERTYVPQYAEKTIKVPTYVEKTIRVPTYVEKTIKVPIESKIIEKEVSREHVAVPAVKVTKEVEYHGGHYGGGGLHYGGGGGGGIAVAHAHGHGGGLFDGIFNIPIQTLGAVNGFLNGLSGGGGGGGGFHASAGFAKGYSAY